MGGGIIDSPIKRIMLICGLGYILLKSLPEQAALGVVGCAVVLSLSMGDFESQTAFVHMAPGILGHKRDAIGVVYVLRVVEDEVGVHIDIPARLHHFAEFLVDCKGYGDVRWLHIIGQVFARASGDVALDVAPTLVVEDTDGLCVAQVDHADFRHLLGHVKEIRKGDDEPLHYVCAAGTLVLGN